MGAAAAVAAVAPLAAPVAEEAYGVCAYPRERCMGDCVAEAGVSTTAPPDRRAAAEAPEAAPPDEPAGVGAPTTRPLTRGPPRTRRSVALPPKGADGTARCRV